MRILVIRFSSIGDIVNTSAVLRCVRAKWPDAHIGFATKLAFSSLVQNNVAVNMVHALDADFDAFLTNIKVQNYTHVIDLHNNLRSRKLTFKLPNVAVLRFAKWNMRKWLRVNFKWNTLPMVHINTRYFDALAKWGVVYDGAGLDFEMAPDVVLPMQLPADFVALVIGGSYATKRMPLPMLRQLLQLINMPIVVIGGLQDVAVANVLEMDGAINTCGKLSLQQSALVIAQAHAVISNDTGMMHIAAALRKKLLSVWGSTVREFGFFPLRPPADMPTTVYLENNDLSCRPCSKLGYSNCPKGHFKCMHFTAQQMQEKLNELLE